MEKNVSNNLSSVLKDLMDKSDQYNTVPKLATALYEKQLVCVKQKEYPFDDEFGTEKRKNAVGSIIKKIREHLKDDSTRTVQADFLCAYAELFHCSVDYLLGRTDVMSPDIDVQQICQKTGLSEKAVIRLLDDSSPQWLWNEIWSVLIESELYESLPYDWLSFGNSLISEAHAQGRIDARNDPNMLEGMDEDEKEKHESETSELIDQKITNHAAAYGALYKMTRDISKVLEDEAKSRSWIEDTRKEALEEEIKKLDLERFLRGGRK